MNRCHIGEFIADGCFDAADVGENQVRRTRAGNFRQHVATISADRNILCDAINRAYRRPSDRLVQSPSAMSVVASSISPASRADSMRAASRPTPMTVRAHVSMLECRGERSTNQAHADDDDGLFQRR